MRDNVRDRALRELAWLGYDVSAVDGRAKLGRDGLALESMAVAELAVLMEEEFHVDLEGIDLDVLSDMTLDDFVAEVVRRHEANRPS